MLMRPEWALKSRDVLIKFDNFLFNQLHVGLEGLTTQAQLDNLLLRHVCLAKPFFQQQHIRRHLIFLLTRPPREVLSQYGASSYPSA